MAEKKYLDEIGLQDVASHVNTRLKTVTTMPVSADNGAVRLYVGTTDTYIQGHIYQYNSTDSEWVDITSSGQYTAGNGINIDANNEISTETVIFTGTQAEWDILTTAQKQIYTICNITDDMSESGGEGTTVIANPSGTATDELEKLQVDDIIYSVGSAIQVSTMPTASADYLNKIYQYVGTTTQYYTNGYFYKCIEQSSSYVWTEVNVQDSSAAEEMTKAQYDALSTAQKNDGTIRFITDITPMGGGDMLTSIYDPDNDVAEAGGIPDYVAEHSGIDGSTVTPIDSIATWLKCAGLHQSYTTLNEVLADSGVLYALINSTNAVDYMVRSTTWATSVVANQTAMNYIGNNNYCADTLIANSTWKNALVNSAYADEVFTVVPVTTSESTEVGASSYYSAVYPPWKAFDQNLPSGTNFTGWAPSGTSGKIWYHFSEKIKAIKFSIYFISRGATGRYVTGKFIGSNDGTNWTDISNSISAECGTIWHYFDSINNTEYEYIGFDVATIDGNATYGIKLQFYGRSDLPPVDDRIDAKADITAIAYNEDGATCKNPNGYKTGDYFYKNGVFGRAKANIAYGATFTLGTNYEAVDISESVISFSDKTEPISQSLASGATSVTLMTYTAPKNEVKSFYGEIRLATGSVVPSDNDACFGGGLTLTRGGVITTLTYTQMNLMPKVRYNNIPISAVVKLRTGDVVKAVVFQTSGSTITVDGAIYY